MTRELFLAGEENLVASLTPWSQVTLEAAYLSPQAGEFREAAHLLFLREDCGGHLESTTGWLWREFSCFLTNRSTSRTVNSTEWLCLPTFRSSHTPTKTAGFTGSTGKAYL